MDNLLKETIQEAKNALGNGVERTLASNQLCYMISLELQNILKNLDEEITSFETIAAIAAADSCISALSEKFEQISSNLLQKNKNVEELYEIFSKFKNQHQENKE